jgi:Rap1a immunity proteins
MIGTSHGMSMQRLPVERQSLATAVAQRSVTPESTRQAWQANLIAASFALSLFAPAASNAAMMSAQDLLTACSGDAVARATCDGYLMAATDLVLRREGRGRANARMCVPPTVTVEQVREAVLNVGQQGRAVRAPIGLGLVAAAMRRSWPCQGSFEQPGTDRGPWPRREPGLSGEPGAPKDQ